MKSLFGRIFRAIGAFALWTAFVCLAGCSSPPYRYVPSDHQTTDLSKRRGEAIYSEPANAPTGTVKVMSMGIVDIKPKQDGKKTPALHLRMSIANQSVNQKWTLDVQEQSVSFPNQGQVWPQFANSDSTSIPILDINPGELRTLDLYFSLPETEKNEAGLAEFNFHWKLQSGDRTITETTPFDRVPVPEYAATDYPYYWPYEPYPYALGWGPVWWSGGVVIVHRR
ncbi:MAG: hypothetical protein P4M08_12235 [Oligoflexia bacterium]|nr:hypothetical protein [Oligoflexia bacterium]